MPKPLLLLDVPYLSWRSHHAIGPLSHEGERTEVLFGLLRDIRKLQDKFGTTRLVFAFDYPPLKRKEIYPEYKGNHLLDSTKDEIAEKQAVREQIFKLRDETLFELGYRNVFHKKGYEADDVIAAICECASYSNPCIIVTADADLLQCLQSDIVQWYNPRRDQILDWNSFELFFDIQATEWPLVKALAGCPSDNIRGIKGVREKTAVKFINGQLKLDSKINRRMLTYYDEIVAKNLPLVKLPYPGIGSFELEKDEATPEKWKKVCRKQHSMPSSTIRCLSCPTRATARSMN